ncbi:hypothetical protein [Variovorax boronicumulans]
MPQSSCPSHQTADVNPDDTQVPADAKPAAPNTSSLSPYSGIPTPEEAAAVLRLIDNFDRALHALIHETQSDPTR